MTLTNLQYDNLAHDIQGVEDNPSLLDNSLTSLSWLQNLRVLDLVSDAPTPVFPPSPGSENDLSWENVSLSSPELVKKEPGISLSPIRKCLLQSAEFRARPRKYRGKADKPPFGYTTLIYLAIRNSRSGKITLSEICRWIKENFKYYKVAEPSWQVGVCSVYITPCLFTKFSLFCLQNSIRHNLSLNEMFVKVRRSSMPSGKGCHWTISPEYEHILCEESEAQILDHSYSKYHATKLSVKPRKRAHSQSCCNETEEDGRGQGRVKGGRNPNRRKRIKSDTQAPADPCGLPGDLDWVSLLSSQRVNCGSCPSQACRPVFGSPILGPPDLGHIGEPVMCSPLVIPTTLSASQLPETPVPGENKGALLEEAVLKQDSPSPQLLLPWADSQSPHAHPWAESRDSTLHELRSIYKSAPQSSVASMARHSHRWSPESSWSSSCSTTSVTYTARTPLLREACI